MFVTAQLLTFEVRTVFIWSRSRCPSASASGSAGGLSHAMSFESTLFGEAYAAWEPGPRDSPRPVAKADTSTDTVSTSEPMLEQLRSVRGVTQGLSLGHGRR
jgi:hypothetical protein